MTTACLEQMTMKNGFDRLTDLARASPVAGTKHGRSVVAVVAVEEFERLKALEAPETKPVANRKASA